MMSLGIAREALVDLSAALGSRKDYAVGRALNFAAQVADPKAIDEVILQAHLFVGFPIMLEALTAWRQIRPGSGLESAVDDGDEWESRGEEVCRKVYGSSYDKLRAKIAGLHSDVERWMVVGGYGRVIGRPGLDLATRELCTVALLAVWDAPRQLHSHLRGALNAGASAAEVAAALRIAGRHLELTRLRPLELLWKDVQTKMAEPEESSP
jgi:4-carboxymuconolactone decarboxylase